MHQKSAARPSVSTRTADFKPRELPLSDTDEARAAPPTPRSGAAQRIREALRRWFNEEL
jgi:hypothetical protein